MPTSAQARRIYCLFNQYLQKLATGAQPRMQHCPVAQPCHAASQRCSWRQDALQCTGQATAARPRTALPSSSALSAALSRRACTSLHGRVARLVAAAWDNAACRLWALELRFCNRTGRRAIQNHASLLIAVVLSFKAWGEQVVLPLRRANGAEREPEACARSQSRCLTAVTARPCLECCSIVALPVIPTWAASSTPQRLQVHTVTTRIRRRLALLEPESPCKHRLQISAPHHVSRGAGLSIVSLTADTAAQHHDHDVASSAEFPANQYVICSSSQPCYKQETKNCVQRLVWCVFCCACEFSCARKGDFVERQVRRPTLGCIVSLTT